MSNGLICAVWAVPESDSRLLQTQFGLDLHRRNWGGQVAHAHQVVGRASETEDPIHFAHSPMTNFPHQRDRLQPPEALFDALPLSLTDGVTGMSRRSTVDRTAATPRVILRHMRRHPQVAALFHKIPRVESLCRDSSCKTSSTMARMARSG